MRMLMNGRSPLVGILLIASSSVFAQTTPTAPVATTAPARTSPAPAPAAGTTAPAAAPAPHVYRHREEPKPAETPAPAGYTGPVWKKQVTRDIEMGPVDSTIDRLRPIGTDNSLLEMFAAGIKTGKISSFYTNDFSMATRIRQSDFDKLFVGRPDTVAVRDAAGRYSMKVTRKSFKFTEVHKYRVMEEWTSYPGLGKTEVQIVGVAPLRDIIGDDKVTVKGVDAMFWVHYTDDIKALIARYDQYHPNNTLGGHIWADYFKK